MKRILFASDLDNTLLFSYQYRQAEDKCVEYLDGREQGFFTRRTLELLPLVERKTRFVPVTTRSVAQYQRIRWPELRPGICGGGQRGNPAGKRGCGQGVVCPNGGFDCALAGRAGGAAQPSSGGPHFQAVPDGG